MTAKKRILLCCRDPGGAGHILALLDTLRRDGRFEVTAAASGAALRILREAGESPRAFSFAGGRDVVGSAEAPDELLAATRHLLEDVKPDAALSTLSSCGVGIDEALPAVARCPTFVMQDFWGDVNLGLGAPATLYLALDEYAVRLTDERWHLPAAAVGSPKHTRYAQLDVPAMRRTARAAIGVNGEPLVGFFAQSPEIPGHESAFRDLVRAATGLHPRPVLLVRDHLKFQGKARERVGMAAEAGLRAVDVSEHVAVEPWLAACDVALTPFSLCALDHAYLSAYSSEPIGCLLHLLPNEDLQRAMESLCGVREYPLVTRGVGQVARSAGELAGLLAEALRPAAARAYCEAAARGLRDDDPCGKIAALLHSDDSANLRLA